MIQSLREYLLCLVAAAMLTAIAAALLPDGKGRNTVRLAGGLVMAVVLLRPLQQLDPAQLAKTISRVQLEYSQQSSGIEVSGLRVQGQVISQQTQAYILSKAEELGLAVTVEVETRQEELYVYPWQVTITGAVSQEDREVLERYIEANLAIPTERQIWIPGRDG